MATQVYSESQKAHAAVLLSRSHAWVRGTRKSDGLGFVIFESSRKNKDGQAVGYYTTKDSCCCPGFFHRGACSHQLAVSLEAERYAIPAGWEPMPANECAVEADFLERVAREADAAPRRKMTYSEIMDRSLVDAF